MTKYNSIYKFIEDYEKKNPAGHYFDRKTLKFFGERLSDMRVLKQTAEIVDYSNITHKCYIVSRLQRKHPNGPTRTYAYFDVETLDDISPLMTYSKR